MAGHHSARPQDHAALAEQVRAMREARGWARERLAKEAGISVSTLVRLESEGAIQPGFFTVGAVAQALDVSLDDLFREAKAAPGLWSAGYEGRDVAKPAPLGKLGGLPSAAAPGCPAGRRSA